MELLSKEQLESLSSLLLATVIENITIGLEILKTYPHHVVDVYRELVLLFQLGEDEVQKLKAQKFLEQAYDAKQLALWNEQFQIFAIQYELYSYEDYEQCWSIFEAHEGVRQAYMPYIRQNHHYAESYYYIGEGIANYYPKRIDLAETYYKIPLECNPHNLSAINNLANLYKRIYADYDQALACYDKMLVINPKHYGALTQKAGLYLDYYPNEDANKAVDLLKEALSYYPKDYYLEVWLADAYISTNDKKQAAKGLQILEKITKKNPGRSSAWIYYGNHLWITFGDIKASEKAYKEGLKYHPNSCTLLGNLAEMYDNEYEDYAQAEKYYDEALSISPDDVFHLINYIAMLVCNKKDLKKAKPLYQRLQKQAYQQIRKEPETTEKQWLKFLEAQDLLWKKYPKLKEW